MQHSLLAQLGLEYEQLASELSWGQRWDVTVDAIGNALPVGRLLLILLT